MKREIPPPPVIGFVVAFIGGFGFLLGVLSLFPLARQATSSLVRQATGGAIAFSLGAFGASIAGSIVAERLLRRNATRQTEQNKNALEQAWSQEVKQAWTLRLRKRDREDLGLLLSTSPPYEDAVADLQRQLAKIAERVEKQKNEIVEVQKIDPILEATLKASVENLVKRIETLEKKQLERWDVALVCFAMISAFAALISVVLGVARYVMGY